MLILNLIEYKSTKLPIYYIVLNKFLKKIRLLKDIEIK